VPPASSGKSLNTTQQRKARAEADSILHQFLTRLREVKILDPACGSGNFLYVALLRLKDLEREAAVTFPSEHGLNTYLPGVGPWQLYTASKSIPTPRPRPDDGLDRLAAVDTRQRLRLPRRPDPAFPLRQHPAHEFDPCPRRHRTRMADRGFHCRQPAVLGREDAAPRTG
jgi:hypothetical protein